MPIRASRARPEIAALALALSGCVTVAPTAPAGAMAPLPLLAPATYGGSAHVEQTLSAAYGASEATLQCFLDITPTSLSVIGLTAGGQRVFSLQYDGATLKAERATFAPDTISPQRIVGDLQLAFWPLSALQSAAIGSDWEISEPRDGLRRARYAGRLVAEAHRSQSGAWPARLWLSNFAYDYSLDIRSQTQTTSP